MDSRMEFKEIPVPNIGYGTADYGKPKYYRVWHSKTQRNPHEFVTEEVTTNIVKAKTPAEAKRRIKNTYKHHVLKVEEVTDIAELNEVKQKLYEKKAEEVV